jgi:hypothetical protein
MLYGEIIAVCSQIHTKQVNTLCGQNVEFLHVKPGGTYSYHWALEGYNIFRASSLSALPSVRPTFYWVFVYSAVLPFDSIESILVSLSSAVLLRFIN